MTHPTKVATNILYSQQAYPDARTLQEDVCRRQEELKGPGDAQTLNSRYHLSLTYCALGLFDKAEAIHNEDIPHHVSLYSKDHNLTLKSRSELARVLTRQDRWEMAEQQYEELIKSYDRMGLQKHRSALTMRIGLAYAKTGQGRYDDSLRLLKEILKEADEG